MEAEVTDILLGKGQANQEASFQLHTFSLGLQWVFLDYSSWWRAGISWSIFFLLNIGVPLVSYFEYSCDDCDIIHRRPFDAVVQLSLSVFTTLSFLSLSSFARRYGLRKFLFLDKLCEESLKVRNGYTDQIHRSMKLLSVFVLPCFIADSAFKIWWFSSVGTQIPYVYNMVLSKIVICSLMMCSWLYRISICFLVCVLFHLKCCLQILRLEDFAQVFLEHSDVASIMKEHLRIRKNLQITSHRFRLFILSTLVLVTTSQFVYVLVTTKPRSEFHFFNAGDIVAFLKAKPGTIGSWKPLYILLSILAIKFEALNLSTPYSIFVQLSSMTLVTGLFICLRSAAKITHKVQGLIRMHNPTASSRCYD